MQSLSLPSQHHIIPREVEGIGFPALFLVKDLENLKKFKL